MAEVLEKAEASPEVERAEQNAATERSPAVGRPPGEPFEIAVLALQNTTLFPETVVPLAVGRPRSVAAVEAALATEEKLLACITVRPDITNSTEDAGPADLYQVGTLTMI
jgi:ATP-dependent Lon protease